MRHPLKLLLIACAAWMVLPGRAAAQQVPRLEGALADSIVITASRYPEHARSTGRRVVVWTAEDIERLPVTSVDDLLRTAAGVDVQSRGGFGIQSDLSIRGSGFNGVLLLLDGAPVNDPMTGHFLADLPVPLSEIARIEVLRGPAAAVYGPDALGGVVQIVTYAGLRPGAAAPALDTSVKAGQHDLYDVNVSASGAVAGMYVDAASAWQGTNGERVAGNDTRSDFRRRVHTAAFSSEIGDAAVFGRVGWDDRAFGAFHFYTPFDSDTAREATSTLWAQARLETDAWSGHLQAKQHVDRYVYNPVTPANEHTSRMVNAFASHRWTLGRNLAGSTGLEAGLRGIDSNNLGVHHDVSAGVVGALRWIAGPASLHAGANAEYDPAYGIEISPQASAAVQVGRAGMHAGVARAVRAPNYIERYFNTTLVSPRGRSLGYPDLRPERAWSVEAGVNADLAAGLGTHVTVFRRLTRDLIDYAMSSPADTVFLARNLHRVSTHGVEAEVEVRTRLAKTEIRMATALSVIEADLGDVDEDVSFKYALTHAKRLAQGSLSARRGRVEAGARTLFKDPIHGDAYVVTHVRAAYTHPTPRGRLTLSVDLRNVFDAAYADVFDAPMPGRWWLMGARWRP